MIYASRTLFLTSQSHLWVVITNPIGQPPRVAIASFTTRREGSDSTVVLRRGDHPFIRHDTVVYYADTRMANPDVLEGLIRSGTGRFHEDCSDRVLDAIQRGLLESPFTPEWIKGVCRPHLE